MSKIEVIVYIIYGIIALSVFIYTILDFIKTSKEIKILKSQTKKYKQELKVWQLVKQQNPELN